METDSVAKVFDIFKILPASDEFPLNSVPADLQYNFFERLEQEMAKDEAKGPPPTSEKPLNRKNVKDLDKFFAGLGDTKTPATLTVPKRNTTIRRSLDNNTSKSMRSSFTVEEFPMKLLQENARQLNMHAKEIAQELSKFKGIHKEKESFELMLCELEEAKTQWLEKTKILSEKVKEPPKYEDGDTFLSRDTKPNLDNAQSIISQKKALKGMETKLAETVPDPSVTADSMSQIKGLVSSFITNDKFQL